MTVLNETQISALRVVVEQAPDGALGRLERGLRDDALARTLGPVRGLVGAECEARRARAVVFAPILPLCTPGSEPLNFPRDIPGRLWRGLKLVTRRQVEAAVTASQRPGPDQAHGPAVYDNLCREAAASLRGRANAEFAAAADLLEAGRAGDADLFAGLLDLAPVARAALRHLPDWLNHMDDDAAAATRLAFKDATDVAEDAGLRLMEILSAHMQDPGRILRLISAVMDRPPEAYVAASEMAGFGDRLLAGIDSRIHEIGMLDLDAGAEAGASAGRAASAAVAQFIEFERAIDLAPNGPWGQRIARQKRTLAAAVEARLKQAGPAVGQALPIRSKARGAVRGMPDIQGVPDPRLVERALALLAFLDEIRGAAAAGGFGHPRAQAAEALSALLDQYVEDLLEVVHGGDPELAPRARAYLVIAAEFLGLVCDEKAAEVARRRAAAA